MPTPETQICYWDRLTRSWVYADGNTITNRLDLPWIGYGLVKYFEVHIVDVTKGTTTNTVTPYAGFAGKTLTFTANVDNNWNHYFQGYLSGAKSGAVIAIGVSGMGTNVPAVAGRLKLTNSSNQSETVDYTNWSYANGIYAFTVSATLAYSYALSDSCRVLEPCMVKAFNADINQASMATGILTVLFDALNTQFEKQVIGMAEAKNCGFELQAYDTTPERVFLLQADTFVCRNIRDDEAAIAPAPSGNYYTKTESDAKYMPLGTITSFAMKSPDNSLWTVTIDNNGNIIRAKA